MSTAESMLSIVMVHYGTDKDKDLISRLLSAEFPLLFSEVLDESQEQLISCIRAIELYITDNQKYAKYKESSLNICMVIRDEMNKEISRRTN